MNLKRFAQKHGLHDKDIIERVQTVYPSYDKTLHSKIKRPEKYGIRLLPNAEQLIKSAYEQTPQKPQGKGKAASGQVIRLTVPPEVREQLQLALTRDGYTSEQTGLESIINNYLKEK